MMLCSALEHTIIIISNSKCPSCIEQVPLDVNMTPTGPKRCKRIVMPSLLGQKHSVPQTWMVCNAMVFRLHDVNVFIRMTSIVRLPLVNGQ